MPSGHARAPRSVSQSLYSSVCPSVYRYHCLSLIVPPPFAVAVARAANLSAVRIRVRVMFPAMIKIARVMTVFLFSPPFFNENVEINELLCAFVGPLLCRIVC